jgi:hypothetical protein
MVSRSKTVLRWAATLLSALGFTADSVVERNPAMGEWKNGLSVCDIVAADLVTAAELPKSIRPIIFRIVSDEFLAEIREIMTAPKVS